MDLKTKVSQIQTYVSTWSLIAYWKNVYLKASKYWQKNQLHGGLKVGKIVGKPRNLFSYLEPIGLKYRNEKKKVFEELVMTFPGVFAGKYLWLYFFLLCLALQLQWFWWTFCRFIVKIFYIFFAVDYLFRVYLTVFCRSNLFVLLRFHRFYLSCSDHKITPCLKYLYFSKHFCTMKYLCKVQVFCNKLKYSLIQSSTFHSFRELTSVVRGH